MHRLPFFWFSLGLMMMPGLVASQPGYALPGQSVPVARNWIRNNPTLRPGPNEQLIVNRTDTAAQRFNFQASVLPVVGVVPVDQSRVIRTERLSFFDQIQGVTADQLSEALRSIYGQAVFSDFRSASLVYRYPAEAPPAANSDILLVGEVREGEQFAYWWELAQNPDGSSYSGRMLVFLPADLPLLKAHLAERDGLDF